MSRDPYEAVLPRAVAAIRASAALAAKDIKFHSSVDPNAATRFETAGKGLLDLANGLLMQSTPAAGSETLAYGEAAALSEASWKRVSDMLDIVFEKADLAMDEARTPAKATSEYTYLNESADAASLGVVSEKPQTRFRVPVDNTDSGPFRPKLTAKPHAKTPVDQCLSVIDDGHVPPHYPQPYHDEIITSEYPPSVYEVCEPQPSQDWANTTATWVDSVESLEKMISELKSASEIAVDLEHHDLHSYYGITCLMQVSTRARDWLVDTLALRDDLFVLNEIFANPQIVKVFHGANMDIIWLQRDLGLYVVSLFDTYHASRALGLAKFSLAYLLETFAKFRTSKKYQLADWRIRPLPQAMHEYARSDTHFLLNIYDKLRNKLLNAESGSGTETSKIHEVLENSRKVAARRFEYVRFRPPTGYHSGFFSAESGSPESFISSYNIPAEKHSFVKSIFAWRDTVARDLDESPRHVMPNRVITSLCSLSLPITSNAVSACFPSYSKILRERLDDLTALVQDSYKNIVQDALPHNSSLSHSSQMEMEVTPASAGEIEEIFSLVLQRYRELCPDVSVSASASASVQNQLESRIFSNSASPDNAFSLKVSAKDSTVPEIVPSSEVSGRVHAVGAISFAPEYSAAVALDKTSEAAEIADSDAVSGTDPGTDQQAVEPKEDSKEESKEEIVTLMPKKRVHHQKKKAASQEPEAAFDYSASEAKLLDKPENVKSRSKKRSYQTFGKEDSGPQAFKGRKVVTQGKTTSFIKKNK